MDASEYYVRLTYRVRIEGLAVEKQGLNLVPETGKDPCCHAALPACDRGEKWRYDVIRVAWERCGFPGWDGGSRNGWMDGCSVQCDAVQRVNARDTHT